MHGRQLPTETHELLNYLRALPTDEPLDLLAAYTQALAYLKDDLHSLCIFLDYVNISTSHCDIDEIEHVFCLMKVKLRTHKMYWVGYIHFEVQQRFKPFEGVFNKMMDYLRVKVFPGKEELVRGLLSEKEELRQVLLGDGMGDPVADMDGLAVDMAKSANMRMEAGVYKDNDIYKEKSRDMNGNIYKDRNMNDNIYKDMNTNSNVNKDSNACKSNSMYPYTRIDSNINASLNKNTSTAYASDSMNGFVTEDKYNGTGNAPCNEYQIQECGTPESNSPQKYRHVPAADLSNSFTSKRMHDHAETLLLANNLPEKAKDTSNGLELLAADFLDIENGYDNNVKEYKCIESQKPDGIPCAVQNKSTGKDFVEVEEIKENNYMNKSSIFELELQDSIVYNTKGDTVNNTAAENKRESVTSSVKNKDGFLVPAASPPPHKNSTDLECDLLENTQNLTTARFQKIVFKGREFIRIKKIGKGGYSSVYKVLAEDDVYALKQIRVDDRESIRACMDEIMLLRQLNNQDFVIKMIDHEITKDTVSILLECGETDLQRLIDAGCMNLFYIKYIWHSILCILAFIHQNRIVHRDIKPANFVLVGGRLKLIDFGISKSMKADTTSVLNIEKAGTLNYISPEQCTGRRVSRAADVWAAGCILYVMVYKKHIHQSSSVMDVIRSMGEEKPIEYGEANALAVESMRLCLNYDPKKRARAEELLGHPFLRS